MVTSPASTRRIAPGGSSSSGATSTTATLLQHQIATRRAPLLGQRRAARLVQRELEHAESEDCALEPHRRERNAELLEELFLRHLGDLAGGASLHDVREHLRGRLTDRTAAAVEPDLLDHVAFAQPHRDRDLVSA